MKSEHQHSDLVETKIRDGSDRLITSSRTWLEVADSMSKDVATMSSDETVVSAAKVMADKNISCIIVEDNGTITGIVTETDLLKRAVVEAKDFQSTKISEIMTSPVESVSSNLSVLEASEIMDAKSIKRLLVLAEEHLVGVVTQTDLIRVLISYGMWRDVSMIMSRDALGIQKEATVTEAAKAMAARNASSVVIMDDNEVVGIFTERDLFKRVIAQKRHPDRTRVEEVMSSPVVSITPDTSVFSASRIMEKMHVRKLVVMEDKQLYGALSQTDIFMAVKQKLQEEEEKNHRLLELSKSNIYTLLLDGKITYVNPSFMDLLGISDPMELVGENFLPERFWVNPEDGENFLKELQNEMVQTKELNLKDSKGRRVYVTFFSSFAKDAHGKTNGIQGVLQDITSKKELMALREAEKALQISKQQLKVSNEQLKATNQQLESEIIERKQVEEERERALEFMQMVIDGDPDSLMVINRDYTIALANRRVRETTGGQDPVAACLKCHQVSHDSATPCGSGEHPCPMEQVLTTKVPMTTEHIHYNAEGHAIHVEIIAAPIFDEEGEVVQIIESYCDISERLQKEKELAETLAEMERMNRLMTGREERVIEMKKEVNALLAELGREPQYQSVLEGEKAGLSSDISGKEV